MKLGVDKSQKVAEFIRDHKKSGALANLSERQVRGRIRHAEQCIAGHKKQIVALEKTLHNLQSRLSSV